jgi:hypothetical protein
MCDSVLHRLAARIIATLARLLPAERSEWATAIEAELWHIESGWEALCWAVSSFRLCLDTKSLFAKEGVMRRLRLSIPAFAALVAVGLLLTPSFREALTVTFTTPPWSSFGRQERVDDVALKARADKDAEMLAWAALHSLDNAKAVARADEAVALKPEFTWVYYPLSERKSAEPEARLDRLIEWDPENAVPYLAKARLAERGAPFQKKELRPETVAWMQKALAAKRYDGYFAAHFELERDVARRTHSTQASIAAALMSHPIPELRSLSIFLNSRIGECTATSAAHCWEAAHFTEMMQTPEQASELERLIGSRIQLVAYERMLAVNAIREPNQRRMIELQTQRLKTSNSTKTRPQKVLEWNLLSSSADIVQIGGVVFAAAALMLVACLLLKLVRSSARMKSGFMNWLLALMGVSAVVVYVAYKPYAELSAFLNSNAHVSDLEVFMRFHNFWTLPMAIGHFSRSAQTVLMLWWMALILPTLVGVAFVLRKDLVRLREAR